MKTKNTGLIQRHIEKVVLAGGALFLLVVAALTFVGDPYAVELQGEQLPPREAEQRLQSQVDQLDTRLRSDDRLVGVLSERDIPPYRVEFDHRRQQPLIDTERYQLAVGQPGLDVALFQDPEDPVPYHVPSPPMPEVATARAGYGVLGHARDADVQQELVRFVQNRDTGDFRYVSVSATFDMPAYVDRLQQNPPAGFQRLPEGWWMTMRGVAGVYLQREELDPVTGEWGDRRIIEPLPTQLAFGREDPERRWNLAEARQVVSLIREQQEHIARPPFVPLAAPSVWVPPDQARRELTPEQQREVHHINEDIQKRQQNIRTWEERLRRIGGQAPDRGQRQGDNPRDFWREDRPQQGTRNNSQHQDILDQIEREWEMVRSGERRRDEIYGIERDEPEGRPGQRPAGSDGYDPRRAEDYDPRRDQGYDPRRAQDADPRRAQSDPRRAQDFDPRRAQSDPRQRQAEQEDPRRAVEPVQVWAHDLSVEPGQTYRYRLLVTVLNPLFQRRGLPDEQAQEYFNQLALWPDEQELASTEWTTPVRLDPESYFFLVDGQPNTQEATVEVWRLYRGAWRVSEFRVRPGDLIGGEATINEQTVPMRVNSLLVDLVPIAEASGSRGARMIYLDRETNRIRERIAEEDVDSNDRIRLRNELGQTGELADRSVIRW